MSTTILEQHLAQAELYREILDFARSRDTGALGTSGPAGLRVSPVKYFVDDELNLYIQSKGGSKFTNLAANDQVCLLVSTAFADDYHKIKGVQFFGQAQVLEPYSAHYALASQMCPWPHNGDARLIQVHCDHAVYVDRITRADLKQEWARDRKG